MHYYRYRPCTEVSLKELLYSEIFFSSPQECNDPFDSMTFYEFLADRERWARLVNQAIPFKEGFNGTPFYTAVATQLCSLCPLTLEEVLNRNLLDSDMLIKMFGKEILVTAEARIKSLISGYMPATRFFASFSKKGDIPTMWSHYADKHQGFCLIFKAVDGKIRQCRKRKKYQIVRKTPRNFAEQVSYSMPESFEFKDIDYKDKVEPLNAFKCLSAFIYGEEGTETEMADLRREQESHYIQKGIEWKGEFESRLILPPPPAFIMGGHYGYSVQERLFHYEPAHLAGIIFGARMSPDQKQRIKEVLTERKDWSYEDCHDGPTFNFFLFEASLAGDQRSVVINPTGMLDDRSNKPGTENFERLLREWSEGWGWERYANEKGLGSKRTHYP